MPCAVHNAASDRYFPGRQNAQQQRGERECLKSFLRHQRHRRAQAAGGDCANQRHQEYGEYLPERNAAQQRDHHEKRQRRGQQHEHI